MKAKLNTGLATPARKSESVARVESLSRKNNWRANHPLRGRQRVASFSCSKSEYRPCFRGVKGESRVFTRERQPQSSSGVRDRPVGDKRVGVVALRYNDRPKTVGAWLITWLTFFDVVLFPPVLIFYFVSNRGEWNWTAKIEGTDSFPRFWNGLPVWHRLWPTTPPPSTIDEKPFNFRYGVKN